MFFSPRLSLFSLKKKYNQILNVCSDYCIISGAKFVKTEEEE